LTLDQASKVYQLTKIVFTEIKDVNEDGLALIGSLSTIQKEKFKEFIDDFWKYLQHSFKKKDEFAIFKIGLMVLSDIAKSTKKHFVKYLDQTINFLINFLN